MTAKKKYAHYLFDWGDTLMVDFPDEPGPMFKWPKVEAVEGAFETLYILSQRAQCHVATNAVDSSDILISGALNRVGMIPYISGIFCFQNTGFRKPTGEFFDAVLSKLKCGKEDILMVGDNLDNDVTGALEFGMDAVWFNPGRAPVPEGIVSVADLMELTRF